MTAQTYFAEYEGAANVTIELTQIKVDSCSAASNPAGTMLMTDLLVEGGIDLQVRYHIYTNKNFHYFRINIIEDGLAVPPGFQFLIDKKKKMLYDFREGIYSSWPDLRVAGSRKLPDSTISCLVVYGADTAEFVVDQNIPAAICGKFWVGSLPGGVKSYVTKGEMATLTTFRNSHFNFRRKLREARNVCRKRVEPLAMRF